MTRRFELHELDDGHLGVVTPAAEGPDDAGVTTGALGVAARGLLKERLDELLVEDVRLRLALLVVAAILAELDHVLHGLAHGLSAGHGGGDAAVAEEIGGEVAKESLALVGGAVQARNLLPVADHEPLTTRLHAERRGLDT